MHYLEQKPKRCYSRYMINFESVNKANEVSKDTEEGFNALEKIPVEVFGSSSEREERFLSLKQKIEEEREKLGISPEEFYKKMNRVKEFMEDAVLYHRTDLNTAIEVLKRGKPILSLRELEVGRARKKVSSHTYPFDRELGLHRFVFLSTDPERFRAGACILGIETSVLKDQTAIVTFEDILEITRFKCGLSQWELDFLTDRDKEEVLKEYRTQTLNGKHFYEIFCELLALLYRNSPEEYYFDEELRTNLGKRLRDYIGIKTSYGITPEIKVLSQIPSTKVRGAVVFSQEVSDLLIKAKVPSEKISIAPSERREVIFQAFKGLKNKMQEKKV